MGLLGILYTHCWRSMNKWEKIALLGEKGCVYMCDVFESESQDHFKMLPKLQKVVFWTMSVVNWYKIMIWIDFSKKSLLHKTLMPFSVLLLKIWFEATNTQFDQKEWYFLYSWKCGIEASNHICRSNTENAIIVLSNSLFSENGRGIIMIIWLSRFPLLPHFCYAVLERQIIK